MTMTPDVPGTLAAQLLLQVDVDQLCNPVRTRLDEPAACSACRGLGRSCLDRAGVTCAPCSYPELGEDHTCERCAGSGVVQFVESPSLLDQLQAAIGQGGELSSGSRPPGPRLPVAVEAMSVSVEIRRVIIPDMRKLGDRRGSLSLARFVRLWASHTGEWAAASDPAELVAAQGWAARWVIEVRRVLGQAPEAVRYRRRGTCPKCEQANRMECPLCEAVPVAEREEARETCWGYGPHERVQRPVLEWDEERVTVRCTNPGCGYQRGAGDLATTAGLLWARPA